MLPTCAKVLSGSVGDEAQDLVERCDVSIKDLIESRHLFEWEVNRWRRDLEVETYKGQVDARG